MPRLMLHCVYLLSKLRRAQDKHVRRGSCSTVYARSHHGTPHPMCRGQYMSPRGRAAVTAGLTGTGIFMGLLVARRYILRALLGYRGWMYEVCTRDSLYLYAVMFSGVAPGHSWSTRHLPFPLLCPIAGPKAAKLENARVVRRRTPADQYQAASVFVPALPAAPPGYVECSKTSHA